MLKPPFAVPIRVREPRDRVEYGLAAPMQQFAGLLEALPRNFAYGLKALLEKRGGKSGRWVRSPGESG